MARKLSKLNYAIRSLMSHLRPEKKSLDPQVPMNDLVSHKNFANHLVEIGNKPGMRALEVGSREVTDKPEMRRRFNEAHDTGFDFYAGDNVDVVGDAQTVALLCDVAVRPCVLERCFEYLAMPWVVGGHGFVENHFSSLADEYLRFRRVPALYCHSEFLGRKVAEVADFAWSDVDFPQVVGGTKYPALLQDSNSLSIAG